MKMYEKILVTYKLVTLKMLICGPCNVNRLIKHIVEIKVMYYQNNFLEKDSYNITICNIISMSYMQNNEYEIKKLKICYAF